jgi:putative addiction module component (TIGR02574 family)
MNKVDEAWAALRKLPAQEQERLADAILDYAAGIDDSYVLTDEQVAEVERRLADKNAPTLTLEEARRHLAKYLE